MITIIRTEEEIKNQLQLAENAESTGSNYPGMSYEEGMLAMYNWITGDTDTVPIED